MQNMRRWLRCALALGSAAALVGCGSGGDSSGYSYGNGTNGGGPYGAGSYGTGGAHDAGSDAQVGPSITIRSTTLGDVLVDATGMTLYVFKPDTPGSAGAQPTSACAAGCAQSWPPLSVASISVGAPLDAADVTEFDRGGGEMQVAYKGWPLYLYLGDSNPGDTRGDGSSAVWFAAKVPFTPPK
jgi:predicted lipoprotein with Yx(FWY)xxD motif